MGTGEVRWDDSGLTTEQATVIGKITAGETIVAAAVAAGVGRTTVYRWMREDAVFVAELNRCRKEYHDELQTRIRDAARAAVEALHHALDKKCLVPELRMRTALATLRLARESAERSGPTDPDDVQAEWARTAASTMAAATRAGDVPDVNARIAGSVGKNGSQS
jgi:hypothetical protein